VYEQSNHSKLCLTESIRYFIGANSILFLDCFEGILGAWLCLTITAKPLQPNCFEVKANLFLVILKGIKELQACMLPTIQYSSTV